MLKKHLPHISIFAAATLLVACVPETTAPAPAAASKTAFTVSVTDPETSSPAARASYRSNNTAAKLSTDLVESNFGLVTIDGDGNVLTFNALTGDITANADGTYQIDIAGSLDGNSLIVVYPEGTLDITIGAPLPADVLFVPLVSTTLSLDVISTLAVKNLLAEIAANPALADFDDYMDTAQIAALLEGAQELVLNLPAPQAGQTLEQYLTALLDPGTSDPAIAAFQAQVEQQVSFAENLDNTTTVASLYQGDGLYFVDSWLLMGNWGYQYSGTYVQYDSDGNPVTPYYSVGIPADMAQMIKENPDTSTSHGAYDPVGEVMGVDYSTYGFTEPTSMKIGILEGGALVAVTNPAQTVTTNPDGSITTSLVAHPGVGQTISGVSADISGQDVNGYLGGAIHPFSTTPSSTFSPGARAINYEMTLVGDHYLIGGMGGPSGGLVPSPGPASRFASITETSDPVLFQGLIPAMVQSYEMDTCGTTSQSYNEFVTGGSVNLVVFKSKYTAFPDCQMVMDPETFYPVTEIVSLEEGVTTWELLTPAPGVTEYRVTTSANDGFQDIFPFMSWIDDGVSLSFSYFIPDGFQPISPEIQLPMGGPSAGNSVQLFNGYYFNKIAIDDIMNNIAIKLSGWTSFAWTAYKTFPACTNDVGEVPVGTLDIANWDTVEGTYTNGGITGSVSVMDNLSAGSLSPVYTVTVNGDSSCTLVEAVPIQGSPSVLSSPEVSTAADIKTFFDTFYSPAVHTVTIVSPREFHVNDGSETVIYKSIN